jgi:hypothetical protein
VARTKAKDTGQIESFHHNDKAAKVLKAEINKEAWEQLCRTKSRPFKRPDTGKIAVKVINHYGDEEQRATLEFSTCLTQFPGADNNF